MRTPVANRLRGRLPRPSDDSGNIAMLMLVILVSVTVGALLLTMVINQNNSTRFTASRVRSVDAAQAGIDVMLGQFRNATSTGTDNKTYGNADRLPCVPQSAPMTGTANATGTETYSVWVSYYRTDPSKSTGPAMTCSPGYGPFDATTGSHTPRYARITSYGVDLTNPNSASKGRTLTTTYIFQTDDVNIPGGQIQIFPDNSGNKWCMDAGSATPTVGTVVVLRACSTALPPAPQQVWAYRTDLSIQLVSSVTTAQPTGLCLDTSPTAHAVGDRIVLNACNAVGTAPYNQQWSIDDFSRLQGANTSQTDLDNYCITATSQTNLQALTLATCYGGTTDPSQTWVPSPSAGAGASGATNKQIVNFAKFANCIDITGGDPTTPYLILYSCKQNPQPSKIRWNQVFSPALGPPSKTAGPQATKLTAVDTDPGANNAAYCLQDPVALNAYVTVSTSCSSTWTWYQTKDASGNALPYAQVYTIQDSAGRCLALGPATDLLNGVYYKIVVTTCDGSTAQKWNADPSVLASRLTNTGEN